ncbi:EAL domain-containing protein [Marinibacterium profundimaris]|nr:EAL domain-containing protein [Marinibacterium profundimaris]
MTARSDTTPDMTFGHGTSASAATGPARDDVAEDAVPDMVPDRATAGNDDTTLDIVREALLRGDTMLAYQPVMGLRAPQATAFYEGQIRLLDPAGRVIPARDFIDVIDPTELGRMIDRISLETALKALARVSDIRLSINVSTRSIGCSQWMQVLDRALKRHPDLGARLILEISEHSAFVIPDVVAGFISELQLKGIAFALDDFGAGTIAFRHFRDLDFDLAKIDGQFVRGIHANPDNQVLTAALVDIARRFDMFTVAERVEDTRDAEVLTRLGVDCAQGHLYGAPTLRPPWASRKAHRHRA